MTVNCITWVKRSYKNPPPLYLRGVPKCQGGGVFGINITVNNNREKEIGRDKKQLKFPTISKFSISPWSLYGNSQNVVIGRAK